MVARIDLTAATAIGSTRENPRAEARQSDVENWRFSPPRPSLDELLSYSLTLLVLISLARLATVRRYYGMASGQMGR